MNEKRKKTALEESEEEDGSDSDDEKSGDVAGKELQGGTQKSWQGE